MRRQQKLIKKSKTPERSILLGLPVLLTIIGLLFIFESSSVNAFRTLGDSFYFIKLQGLWFLIGVVVMLFFSRFDYRKLYYLSVPALVISLVLLVAVLIPGIGTTVSGARRWIDLEIITIQPSELVKFAVILYLSSWFSTKERHRFIPFLILMGFILALVMAQPDMGTAIIIFSLFIVIYFLSGQELAYLLLLLPAAAAGFFMLVQTSAYRMRRLTAFLSPQADPQGVGYHINQILISLSSGGVLGRGFSESRQKYQFLPEAHTDSIFAIIGEELGFVGGMIIIFLYFLLMYYAYRIASRAKDKFAQLLAGAIFSIFALQVIINLGGMVALIPLTGVPLPFISYGGSSLLISFALMGILVNIARRG